MSRELGAFISGLPFFANVSSSLIKYVVEKGALQRVPGNTTVLRQGESAPSMFIVLSGVLKLFRTLAQATSRRPLTLLVDEVSAGTLVAAYECLREWPMQYS